MKLMKVISQAKAKAEIIAQEVNNNVNESKVSVDDSMHDQELEIHASQNKRIEQMMFKELYQKTIERGSINFNSKDDMEVMIAAMKKKIKNNKDKAFIISAISQIGVFANHPMIFKEESVTTQLFREIKIEQFTKRSTIFNQGDIGDTYYMIVKGEVYCLIPTAKGWEKVVVNAFKKKKNKRSIVSQNQNQETEQENKMLELKDEDFLQQKFPQFKLVKTFKQWEGFGDIALITQQYRTATMVCKEDSYCITMTKSGFDKIIGELSRQQKITQVKFLKQFPFFSSIPKSKLMSILMDLEVMKYTKNKVLYEEGQPITHVYFIIEGENYQIIFNFIMQVELYKKLSVELNRDNLLKQYEVKIAKETSMNKSIFTKKALTNIRYIGLSILGSNSYFGIDELFNGKAIRESSAKCISTSATLYVLSKDKFLDSLKVYKQLEKDHTPSIEKDILIQQRAVEMTNQIQESLNKISKNISLGANENVEEEREKRLKPLTNPRDIIKERIILNKEFVPDRMIKQNSSVLNVNSESRKSNEFINIEESDAKSIMRFKSKTGVNTFYSESNRMNMSASISQQMISPINKIHTLNSPLAINKNKSQRFSDLHIQINQTFNLEDQKELSLTPDSKEGNKISDFQRLSPQKIKLQKDIFVGSPLSQKKIALSRSLTKFSKQDESFQSTNSKLRSESQNSATKRDEQQLLRNQSSNSQNSPFNKEEMQIKIDFCEKSTYEKMNRHLSYMKKNNMLKSILNGHQKSITPSNHMNQYFVKLNRNKSQNTSCMEVNISSSLNNTASQKNINDVLFQPNTSQVHHQSFGSNQNIPFELEKSTQKEFTRLQYLNQIQKQIKNIEQISNQRQLNRHSNAKSLTTYADSSPQKADQEKYLSRTKKMSPAQFFQDLFYKKQQVQIQEASSRLDQFQNKICQNRKNISIDWQQRVLMKDGKFLENVNKQDTSGSSLDRFIENKYSNINFINNSENTKHDSSASSNIINKFDIHDNQVDSVLEDKSSLSFSKLSQKGYRRVQKNSWFKNSFLNSPLHSPQESMMSMPQIQTKQ